MEQELLALSEQMIMSSPVCCSIFSCLYSIFCTNVCRFVFSHFFLSVLCFKSSDYPYGIFKLFFYLISETMILGGVDVYLTNITTVYLPVYGLPILISLIVFVLTMSLFKMWIVDLERRKVWIVDREVRRSNKIRSNRKRSQLVQSTTTSRNFEAELVQSTTTSIDFEAELVQSTTTSIDFEAELDKPYGKALKEFYSDEQIKQALIYMNQKGKCT